LYDIRNTPIVRHSIVEDKNPFKREDIDYFQKRRLKGAKVFRAWDKRRLKFVKKQKYLCPVCEELLLPQQQIELHHILAKSKGGSDKDANLVALHNICHKQVTHSNNPSLLAQFKEKGILKSACWLYCFSRIFFECVVELYAVKVARTVLKGGKLERAYLSASQGFATWKH
jgi:hypothetical protein